MRVFKADLFHLIKDKLFYVLLFMVFLLPLVTCFITNGIETGKLSIESLIFQGLSVDILCVIIGIQLSSFIGREYQNHTIRNKICYGEGKIKVALIFMIDTIVISAVFIVISILSSLLFGLIFCGQSFSGEFIPKLFCQCLIIISFSMCVSCVVISSKSMKSGFIFVVIISILLGAVSYVFPISAASNSIMAFLSRILYMVVSNMLIKSNCGIYQVSGYTFNHLYINAILVSFFYLIISSVICLLIVRRHEYK